VQACASQCRCVDRSSCESGCRSLRAPRVRP
jgi:hypothetical protein